MPQVTVWTSPPTAAPETFPNPASGSLPKILNLGSSSGIDIELLGRSGGSAVRVRPWFYKHGNWWGLGVDGNSPTIKGVTADPANLNGNGLPYGHGRYIRDRTNVN